jgi:hypothetical protein
MGAFILLEDRWTGGWKALKPQDCRCPDRGSNRIHLEYKSEALPFGPTGSAYILARIWSCALTCIREHSYRTRKLEDVHAYR